MSGPDKDKRPARSGQVRHDPGGRAIWEWAIESGRHAIDSTSRLLQKLDLSSLRLISDDEKAWEKKPKSQGDTTVAGKTRQPEPPAQAPKLSIGGEAEPDPLGGKGFNPYDSRTPTGRGVARPAPKPPRPRITQPVRPAPKPGLFARLFGGGKR